MRRALIRHCLDVECALAGRCDVLVDVVQGREGKLLASSVVAATGDNVERQSTRSNASDLFGGMRLE